MTVTTAYNSKALQQPEEVKVAEYWKEHHMTAASIKFDIKSLREWLSRNPHLPNIDDDSRLEHILFYCKNSLQKSKQEIEKHYTMRTQYPEFFSVRDPLLPKLADVEKIATYVPLPKLTKAGQRVVVFKVYTDNIDTFDAEAFCTRTFMTYDFRLSHDLARTDILVYDLSNVSMNVLGVMPLQMIKKLMSIGTNAFPFRLSAFVVYNPSKMLENVINISKTFIPKKLSNRVQAIRGIEKLHELVPKEILPKDYQGEETMTLEEMRDQWDEELIRHRDWFIREQDLKVDEFKRTGKQQEDRSSLEGSFRKIAID